VRSSDPRALTARRRNVSHSPSATFSAPSESSSSPHAAMPLCNTRWTRRTNLILMRGQERRLSWRDQRSDPMRTELLEILFEPREHTHPYASMSTRESERSVSALTRGNGSGLRYSPIAILTNQQSLEDLNQPATTAHDCRPSLCHTVRRTQMAMLRRMTSMT
jgi:hypothetical protein